MADSHSSMTPEKRLLNLIESSGKAEGSHAEPAAKQPSERPLGGGARLAGVPGAGPMDGFLGLAELLNGFKNRFSLKALNRTTQIVLVSLSLAALVNAVYEWKISERDPLTGLDVQRPKVTPPDEEGSEFDASRLQAAESRNVFLPFAKREEVQAVKESTGGSNKLIEMTKTLKLTGISFNPDSPETTYCMIEDLQKNITVFLREGDRISGLKVNKIRDESVELEYENEKMEIR